MRGTINEQLMDDSAHRRHSVEPLDGLKDPETMAEDFQKPVYAKPENDLAKYEYKYT